MSALSKIWHDILLVWTFFTRIPAPPFVTTRILSQALWALPLVSLVISGAQITALSLIATIGLDRISSGLSAFALVVVPIVLTGALHWDGLADLADALGVSKNRRAEVMRDSKSGSFAVLTLIGVFVLQLIFFAVLIEQEFFSEPLLILWTVAFLSRQLMALLWALLPATDLHSQANRLGKPNFWVHGALLVVSCGAVWSFSILGLKAIIALCVFALVWSFVLKKWLGGVNGDGLGATQLVTETLVLMLILLSHV